MNTLATLALVVIAVVAVIYLYNQATAGPDVVYVQQWYNPFWWWRRTTHHEPPAQRPLGPGGQEWPRPPQPQPQQQPLGPGGQEWPRPPLGPGGQKLIGPGGQKHLLQGPPQLESFSNNADLAAFA